MTHTIARDLSFRIVLEMTVALESTLNNLSEFCRKCVIVEEMVHAKT